MFAVPFRLIGFAPRGKVLVVEVAPEGERHSPSRGHTGDRAHGRAKSPFVQESKGSGKT